MQTSVKHISQYWVCIGSSTEDPGGPCSRLPNAKRLEGPWPTVLELHQISPERGWARNLLWRRASALSVEFSEVEIASKIQVTFKCYLWKSIYHSVLKFWISIPCFDEIYTNVELTYALGTLGRAKSKAL